MYAVSPIIAILSLTLFDIWIEPEPLTTAETLLDISERILIVIAMVAIAWNMSRIEKVKTEQTTLHTNLERAIARGEEWREKSRKQIGQMGQAIIAQFEVWELSPAETDIAGLILKGASLREIAVARETSEVTIRQQAQGIYRKSGLTGRVELSAYFLESLFEVAEFRNAVEQPEYKI